MAVQNHPVSIRLSESAKDILDSTARRLRRSRSYVVEEMLKHQSQALEESAPTAANPIEARLKSWRERADAATSGRDAKTIDAMIRELRGDH